MRDDFTLARTRLVDEVRLRPNATYRRLMTCYGNGGQNEACRLRQELRPGGTWADIDFNEKDPTNVEFPPLRHVARALQLALHGFLDEALAALDTWRTARISSDNWWYNEIAAPQLVADTLLAASDRLTTAHREQWGRWLAGTAGGVPLTGDNLLWAKAIVLRQGLLTADSDLVESAKVLISSVLQTTDADGIQEDFTYHHHGPLLYSGNYGAALGPEVALWVWVLNETRWALSNDAVSTFANFLLEGQRWAVHGGGFDFPTMGRAVSRSDGHNSVERLRTTLDRLLRASPPRREELEAFDCWLAAADSGDTRQLAAGAPVGSRYFPCSDYLVHRRPTWSVTVRMSSSRTIPTESLLGENLRGRYLGDGVAPVRLGHAPQDGYRAALPLWDWSRLPGVTAARPERPDDLFPRANGERGTSAQVDGWANGSHGIAVMRLCGTDSLTDGWKAWFCFPDWFVALGTAISAPYAHMGVVTTIDQRLAVGPVTVGPTTSARQYVHHGRLGYISLSAPEQLIAGVEQRTGSWADISQSGSTVQMSAPLFSVGFDHGPCPQAASYACLVLPDIDAATVASRAEAPGVVIESDQYQSLSVRCERTGTVLGVRLGERGPIFESRSGVS
jgi:chondroitin AC lyase